MKKALLIIFTVFLVCSPAVFSVTYDSSALTNKISQNKSLADSFFQTFSGFVNDLTFEAVDGTSYNKKTSKEDEEDSDEYYSDDEEEYEENSDYEEDEDDSYEYDYEYELHDFFDDAGQVLDFISDTAEVARDLQDGYETVKPFMDMDPSRKLFNLKFKTSLDAVYYTGFDIKTDYGKQEGALVQGYSDLLLGLKILDTVTLAFGTAGSRYGVFLTDIDFNIPSGDPVDNITVNDFMGTQIMTDIYCGVLGVKNIVWLGGYFFSSANYKPEDSGILSSSKESSVDYWGIKGQLSSLATVDLLFDKKYKLQSFDWSLNAWNIALFLLQKPLGYNFSLTAGMSWYTKEELSPTVSAETISKINWNRFDIPINLHYTLENTSSYAYFEGALSLSVSDTFKSFYVGKANAGVTANHLFRYYYDGQIYYYRIGALLKGSFYSDENLKYHGSNKNDYAFGIETGLSFSPGRYNKVLINASWRYNYIEDLTNLIESKDKHVFTAYLTLGL